MNLFPSRGSLACRLFVIMALGLVFFAARRADAGDCAAPAEATPALTLQDDALRLQFIRESLRDAARVERRFAVGWSITYAGLAGASWVLVPLGRDPRGAIDAAWNSAKALGASVLVLIEPFRVVRAHRRMEDLLAGREAVHGHCAQLALAEELLAQAARSERRATHVLNHLGTLALNIGLGMALGYGLDRPAPAAMGVAMGTVISEVMMATRPKLAVRRMASYRAGDLHVSEPPSGFSLAAFPTTLGSGYGVAIGGSY